MQALKVVPTSEPTVLEIHGEAMASAKDLKAQYLKLFEILLVIERRQIYYQFEITSLQEYCMELLELSRDVSKDFVAVVRRSLEIPQLADAVRSKRLTISKARKICSVLSPANHREWIELAIHCSCRIVEKAVAMANPKEAVKESIKYVSGEAMEFKLGVDEEWAELLERTKDIASQKERKTVASRDALFIAMAEYCKRNDSLEKAKRASERKLKRSSVSRATFGEKPLSRHRPALIEHVVNLRDQCQCTYVDERGKRCTARRWLNKHHIVEFANGGDHSPENLETLCWGHHKIKHLKSEASVT